MKWADGDKYSGGWKDDKRDGEGIMVLSNGIKIKQLWRNGQKLKEN